MFKQFLIFALISYSRISSAKEEPEEIEYDSSQLTIMSVTEIPTKDFPTVGSLNIDDGLIERFSFLTKAQNKLEEEVLNINEVTDQILSTIAGDLLLGGGDPVVLPNWNVIFQYRPLLITYTGTLDLTSGQLQDLATLRRNGNATLTVSSSGTIKVSIPISFRSLIASYSFIMRVRWDTAQGILHAWFNNAIIRYNLIVDVAKASVTNRDFVLDVGSLTTNLFGTGLTSSYRRLITDLTSDLLIQTAREYADTIVGRSLDDALSVALGIIWNVSVSDAL